MMKFVRNQIAARIAITIKNQLRISFPQLVFSSTSSPFSAFSAVSALVGSSIDLFSDAPFIFSDSDALFSSNFVSSSNLLSSFESSFSSVVILFSSDTFISFLANRILIDSLYIFY